MPNDNEENNLDAFFEMIDSIEDDISEMLEDGSNELGGYECLVICFNYLKLYCGQVGIDFGQIENHYNEFKESQAGEAFWNFDIGFNSKKGDEVEACNRMLEEVENTLTAFEKRCEKTGESFDEWSCVFIMYTCLRKYCDEKKTNYGELINDALKLQSDLEKGENAEPEDIDTLNR